MMRRREFIAGLGAAAWPVAARAQQGDRVRRVGVLIPGDENDRVYKSRVSAFTQALADLGWTEGRNVRMDLRWAGADTNRIRTLAQELVGSQPDIILPNGTAVTAAVQQLCQRRRFARLRGRPGRQLASCRNLCRSHSTR
jgi:putative ABC transport system substrate-binding protein